MRDACRVASRSPRLCQKCSGTIVTGPTYRVDPYGHERLGYTCDQCGFSWFTPTADQGGSTDSRIVGADRREAWFPIQQVGLIPWSVAARAYERYAQLYGRAQSLEHLAARGGFGLAELGCLLRGTERRADSQENDRDWHQACEVATRTILYALTHPPVVDASDPPVGRTGNPSQRD